MESKVREVELQVEITDLKQQVQQFEGEIKKVNEEMQVLKKQLWVNEKGSYAWLKNCVVGLIIMRVFVNFWNFYVLNLRKSHGTLYLP